MVDVVTQKELDSVKIKPTTTKIYRLSKASEQFLVIVIIRIAMLELQADWTSLLVSFSHEDAVTLYVPINYWLTFLHSAS